MRILMYVSMKYIVTCSWLAFLAQRLVNIPIGTICLLYLPLFPVTFIMLYIDADSLRLSALRRGRQWHGIHASPIKVKFTQPLLLPAELEELGERATIPYVCNVQIYSRLQAACENEILACGLLHTMVLHVFETYATLAFLQRMKPFMRMSYDKEEMQKLVTQPHNRSLDTGFPMMDPYVPPCIRISIFQVYRFVA